jgi:hypothetical protein
MIEGWCVARLGSPCFAPNLGAFFRGKHGKVSFL